MFFDTLAQVTGTILGLLLALIAGLYSVKARRADSNIEELRNELSEFDNKYNAVLRELSGVTISRDFETSELHDLDEIETDFEETTPRKMARDFLTKGSQVDRSKEEITKWANKQPDPALAHAYAHIERVHGILAQLRSRPSGILTEIEVIRITESSRVLSDLIANHDTTLYFEIVGSPPEQNPRRDPVFSTNPRLEAWLNSYWEDIENRWVEASWEEDTREGKTLQSLAIFFRELEVDSSNLMKLLPGALPALEGWPTQELRRIIIFSAITGCFGIVVPLFISLILYYNNSSLANNTPAVFLGAILLFLTLLSTVFLLRETYRFIMSTLPV